MSIGNFIEALTKRDATSAQQAITEELDKKAREVVRTYQNLLFSEAAKMEDEDEDEDEEENEDEDEDED